MASDSRRTAVDARMHAPHADTGVQGHACATSEAETLVPPDEDFLHRWVYANPELTGRDLLFRWLEDPAEREDIAASQGMKLGELLRPFNETAKLSDPVEFMYRYMSFSVVAMAGICDDVAGDRYPRFGAPVTLRCYYTAPGPLPQDMHDAADWNFMDAGRPGYLGYAYGVRFGPAVYLAGLQSDLAVRYSYLFQGRDGSTAVRDGDEVTERDTAYLAARYGRYIPVLRRTFQRYWMLVLLGAVCAWARTEPELSEFALLKYVLEPAERERGNVVGRLYRELPSRLGSSLRCVRAAGRRHLYFVSGLDEVEAYLGERWQPVPGLPTPEVDNQNGR
jgi:hypothetical protein